MEKGVFCLVVFIFCMIFVGAQTQTSLYFYYNLNLSYDRGAIEVSSANIEFFQEEVENLFGDYTTKVLDYENNVLNISFFDVPNEILYDTVNPETGEISGGGILELNQTTFNLFIPYYENALRIIIYDENSVELARIDVGEYSKEGLEETRDIEEGERESIEERASEAETIQKYWWVLLIILIILVVVLFYSLKKKRR